MTIIKNQIIYSTGNGNGNGKKHVSKNNKINLKNYIQQLPNEIKFYILNYTDYYTFNFFKKNLILFLKKNYKLINFNSEYNQFIYYLNYINNQEKTINDIKLSYIFDNLLKIFFIFSLEENKIHDSYSKLFNYLIIEKKYITNKMYLNHLNDYYSIVIIQFNNFIKKSILFNNWKEKLGIKINNVYEETKQHFNILKNIYLLLK